MRSEFAVVVLYLFFYCRFTYREAISVDKMSEYDIQFWEFHCGESMSCQSADFAPWTCDGAKGSDGVQVTRMGK